MMLRRFGPFVLYGVCTAMLLWRSLVLGQPFYPMGQLAYVAPWSAYVPPDRRAAWNPLHYDSVAEYRVFRMYATESLRAGRLPLWNPYQSCGAPFVANNLSATYYPGNLLHVLLGPDAAAGWFAAIHVFLAACFMRLFLMRFGASQHAATLAGAVYGFSMWHIAWLHLPPFVATSCWLPALGAVLVRLRGNLAWTTTALFAVVVALVLLAGHLQIAFYVLGTATVLAAWLLWRERANRLPFAVRVIAAYVVAILLAGPQLLPTVELIAHGHRAGGATSEGYKAYVAYATHPAALATLVLPDFFGNPASPDRPYTGFSRGGMYYNYAEGAMYVGLLPLVLVVAGIGRLGSARGMRLPTVLAFFALLIALGTPLAAMLYFGVPGFSGTGSPGRILVLWQFAAAWLAGLGYDAMIRSADSPLSRLAPLIGILVFAAVAVTIGAASAYRLLGSVPWSVEDIVRQSGVFVLTAFCVGVLLPDPTRRDIAFALAMAIVCADLLAHGVPYNTPTTLEHERAAQATMAELRALAGHERIAPINTSWSFAGPEAVLPPNMATTAGIRDAQGYDSLLPAQYKLWLRNQLGTDPSPPEVGNMIFVKRPVLSLLDAMGVKIVLSAHPFALRYTDVLSRDNMWIYVRRDAIPRARGLTEDGRTVAVEYSRDESERVTLSITMPAPGRLELADQYWPGWHAIVDGRRARIVRSNHIFRSVPLPPGRHTVEFRYEPASTRVGVYLLCVGALAVAACMGKHLARRSRVTAGV